MSLLLSMMTTRLYYADEVPGMLNLVRNDAALKDHQMTDEENANILVNNR